MPAGAVQIREEHQGAVFCKTCAAACFGEQQQREQPGRFWLVKHQQPQCACEPNGFGAQAPTRRAGQSRCRDQVDHREHRAKTVGQLVLGRYPMRDAGSFDLVLGAGEPLRHRRLRDEKRTRDLLG
jgi:hypothetical protein